MTMCAKIAGTDKAKVLYFPHAVDGRLFFNDLDNSDSGELPEEISQLSGPIAGYFGSLTATNDQETFISAAKALPSWDFVFIGRVSGDYSNLESLPNVHFLGPKSHKEIPAYGAAFDVCFMGWKDHEWIQNCFPLKTLEYLALQKPVVCSCQIDEITERFRNWCAPPDQRPSSLAAYRKRWRRMGQIGGSAAWKQCSRRPGHTE